MSAKLLDADLILSGNEQWMKLDQEWKPVDLETEEDQPTLSPVFSTLDLRKTTFDSSSLFKKIRRKVGRTFSKRSISTLNYKDFLQDLKEEEHKELPVKQFYFISGQLLSALSVEEICDNIDDIFKSIEKLCSATSTIRHKKKNIIPEVIQCSISASDLSFDDTIEEKEKSDTDDVDRYIDEAFEHLNSTIEDLSSPVSEQSSRASVTTLVRKFTKILRSPVVNCRPRRKRQCCDRFKDLADFWQNRAFDVTRGKVKD